MTTAHWMNRINMSSSMRSDHTHLSSGQIRRATTPPWRAEEIKGRKRYLRHRFAVTVDGNISVVVRYSRSRFWKMDYAEDRPIKMRTIAGWMENEGGSIGRFEFVEFDIGPLVFDEEFRRVLDENPSIEAEMADALLSCWDDIGEEIGAYGTILDFRRVWMHPKHARNGSWAVAAQLIIDKGSEKRAPLTMKAFPLEYEGQYTPIRRAMPAQRQRAMVRYHQRLFGVRPLPGRAGEEGWLFAVPERLRNIITQPEIQKGRESLDR